MQRKRLYVLLISCAFIALLSISMYGSLATPVIQSPEFKFPRVDLLRMITEDDDYTARDKAIACDMDMVCDIVIPEILEALVEQNFTIDQQDGFHLCRIAFNCRDYKPESAGKYYPYRYSPGDPNYPLNVTAVRRAFHYITDKSIIYDVLDGIVTEAFSVVPPVVTKWYYPEISYWPYDNVSAYNELTGPGAAWVFDDGIWVPDPSKGWYPGAEGWPGDHYPDDYIPLRSIYFIYPSETIAPTSDQICSHICNIWNYWLNYWAGTTDVEYIIPEPADYAMLIYPAYANRDFDIWFLCVGLSPDLDFLYYFFHSDNDLEWGSNVSGLRDPYIDQELYKVMFWKDPITHELIANETVIYEASKNVQIALFDYTNPNCLCPWIPIYHRRYTAAFKETVENWISAPGFGAYDESSAYQWTYCHIHPAGQPVGGTVKWHVAGIPQSLNPATMPGWAYEYAILNRILDAGFQWEPWAQIEIPWYVLNWTWEPWTSETFNVPNGMKLTFKLRNDVYWQNGRLATAEDAKWNYDYIAETKFENLYALWMYYVYSEVNQPFELTVYLNVTGLWYIHTYAGNMFVFPKEVWEGITTYEQAEAFEPWTEPAPGWEGPPDTWPEWWPYDFPLTKLFGTGPFVLKVWDTEGRYADLYPNPIFFVNNTRVIAGVYGDTRILPDTSATYHVIIQNVDKYNATNISYEIYLDDGLVDSGTIDNIKAFNYITLGEYETGQLSKGLHIVKAVVTCDGQTFTYEHKIYVTIPEDTNLDFVVNFKDAIILGAAFGSKPGDANWDPRADILKDYVINFKDAIKLGAQFGWDP